MVFPPIESYQIVLFQSFPSVNFPLRHRILGCLDLQPRRPGLPCQVDQVLRAAMLLLLVGSQPARIGSSNGYTGYNHGDNLHKLWTISSSEKNDTKFAKHDGMFAIRIASILPRRWFSGKRKQLSRKLFKRSLLFLRFCEKCIHFCGYHGDLTNYGDMMGSVSSRSRAPWLQARPACATGNCGVPSRGSPRIPASATGRRWPGTVGAKDDPSSTWPLKKVTIIIGPILVMVICYGWSGFTLRPLRGEARCWHDFPGSPWWSWPGNFWATKIERYLR